MRRDEFAKPVQAAAVSALSFTLGAVLPMLAILLPSPGWRVWLTFGVVLVALAVAGMVGAYIGGTRPGRPALRVVVGGAVGLAFTFGIGHLVGAVVS
jgi:VIT1/CCC1 family predicted Fe2+/Mn2+ transporter